VDPTSSPAIVATTLAPTQGDDGGLPDWAIALIVVVGVLVLAGIGAAYYFCCGGKSDQLKFKDLGDSALQRIKDAEDELKAYYDERDAQDAGQENSISEYRRDNL